MSNLPTPVTREEIYLDAIAKGSGGGGSSSADDVSYDNTTSGLSADNVQDAIDEIAQSGGGGITYDIDISGTILSSGDFADKSDYLAADYVANATLENMLTKANEQGKLDIGGCISKAHDSLPGVTINWWCKCVCSFAVVSQTFASLITQLGKDDYESGTDGLMLKVGSPIAGDEDLASLVIYQSTSGVKCFTTTAF